MSGAIASVSGVQGRTDLLLTSTRRENGRLNEVLEPCNQILLMFRLCGLPPMEIRQLIGILSGTKVKPAWKSLFYANCSARTIHDNFESGLRFLKYIKRPHKRISVRHKHLIDITGDRSGRGTDETDVLLNDLKNRISTKQLSDGTACRAALQTKSGMTKPGDPWTDHCRKPIHATISVALTSGYKVSPISIFRSSFSSSNCSQLLKVVLRRGGRTSSCVSEITSLLDHYSVASSRASPHESKLSTDDLLLSILPLHYPPVLDTKQSIKTLLLKYRACSEKDFLHQKIVNATLQQVVFQLAEAHTGTSCPYDKIHCFGNNALFFAARSTVLTYVLSCIIGNTANLDVQGLSMTNFDFDIITLLFQQNKIWQWLALSMQPLPSPNRRTTFHNRPWLCTLLKQEGVLASSTNSYYVLPWHPNNYNARLHTPSAFLVIRIEGANVNPSGRDNKTIRNLVSKIPKEDVLEYLLSVGAKVNYRNRDGQYPINYLQGVLQRKLRSTSNIGHFAEALKCSVLLLDPGPQAGYFRSTQKKRIHCKQVNCMAHLKYAIHNIGLRTNHLLFRKKSAFRDLPYNPLVVMVKQDHDGKSQYSFAATPEAIFLVPLSPKSILNIAWNELGPENHILVVTSDRIPRAYHHRVVDLPQMANIRCYFHSSSFPSLSAISTLLLQIYDPFRITGLFRRIAGRSDISLAPWTNAAILVIIFRSDILFEGIKLLYVSVDVSLNRRLLESIYFVVTT
ncbi:uncharacterized protein BDR25DRAFT_360887 [Lindgomyces ingoldianus]|uniref:Uncharacterized protein n=1 Tax=Lindgomyces ingoldianus TaxID=673940 RepID=A0ACB6QDD8_9PLEO|nr:uncharacterized protein BDR25DRAFT_360887 [Lindgomyces ingoldianus]KAF2464983.1 hypothetical protein BDR25DRAFT_360887 [Lindgomyces ingoldianus]